MPDRESWEEGWPEEELCTGDLAPRVEEYLTMAGTHEEGRPPGFWEELVAGWFEGQRARQELKRMRAEWFDWRRGRA